MFFVAGEMAANFTVPDGNGVVSINQPISIGRYEFTLSALTADNLYTAIALVDVLSSSKLLRNIAVFHLHNSCSLLLHQAILVITSYCTVAVVTFVLQTTVIHTHIPVSATVDTHCREMVISVVQMVRI